MLTSQEVNILGQICDSTFGRSSTAESATSSFKTALSGDVLTVTYTTVVHLASDRHLREQCGKFADASVDLTNDYMKNLRKEFSSNSGRSLTLKELRSDDSVEIITTSPYNPRKLAYYRRVTSFKVG